MLHSRKRSGVLDKTTMIPHKQETGMRIFQPPCGNSTRDAHTAWSGYDAVNKGNIRNELLCRIPCITQGTVHVWSVRVTSRHNCDHPAHGWLLSSVCHRSRRPYSGNTNPTSRSFILQWDNCILFSDTLTWSEPVSGRWRQCNWEVICGKNFVEIFSSSNLYHIIYYLLLYGQLSYVF